MDHAVSPVSKIPAVREVMVAEQRRLAGAGDMVVEGRDIGTVVFPDAEVKVFLTASSDERARRRHSDLAAQGHDAGVDQVEERLSRRDGIDSSRAHSPLAQAGDAVPLDTTELTAEEVASEVLRLVREASA